MAILKGTSQTRFSGFLDSNAGIGQFLNRGQQVGQEFLKQARNVFQSKFVEDGAKGVPAFSFFDSSFANLKEPTRRKTITQKPKATVFIKKRMFSTLRNNFDSQFMDEDEKLFLRAAKVLLRRKCEEIAFYENLISLERLLDQNGFLYVDPFLDDYVDNFFNILEIGFGIGEVYGLDSILNTIEANFTDAPDFFTDSKEVIENLLKLREINRRSKSNKFTTWIVDEGNYDYAGLGPGTGVIELNLISQLSSTCTLKTGGGNCSLTIEDPYRLLLINEGDIEIAIREAKSTLGVRAALESAGNLLLKQAELLDRDINISRRSRGVSEVNFELGLNDVAAKGIILNSGESFDVNSIYSIDGEQAFTAIERAKAVQVLTALNAYQDEQTATLGNIRNENTGLNDLRSRMRKEFLGESIIQHMDSVHIFMNSDTREVTPNYTGSISESVNSLQNTYNQLSDSAIKEEWEVIGKGAVPFPFYKAVRKPSTWRGDGVSVFNGLVNNVSFSYNASDGKFNISVKAEDNAKYLTISRFNTSPSLLQSEGILEDPLTPFDIKTNQGTGLLEEMPKLSQENLDRLPLLRFSDGPNVGDTIKDQKEMIVDQELQDTRELITFEHAPGLIYKWKEGVVSATLNVNSQRPPDGQGNSLQDLQSFYGIPVVKDPFSGLDSADILAILITGQPYNYTSFLKSSIDSGTFSPDTNNRFYFNFLFDFLERQRPVYGNFIPAKQEAIDPEKVIETFRIKQKLDGQLKKFTQLEKRIAELQDIEDNIKRLDDNSDAQIAAGVVANSNNATNAKTRLIREQAKVIEEITKLRDEANLSGMPEGLQLNILGNQTHVDVNEDNLSEFNKNFRYRLKRKPEQVRYNEDNNYFVVSDRYDYDTDIQAFTRELKATPANLFSQQDSDYKVPLTICKSVADTIHFELFANKDGNIVFRPPEYNKTPLSLMIKMLRLSDEGTSIMPDFLRELFKSRLELTKEAIVDKDLKIAELMELGGFEISDFNIELVLNSEYVGTPIAGVDLATLLNTDKLEEQAKNALNVDTSLLTQFLAFSATPLIPTPEKLIRIRNQIAARTGDLKLQRNANDKDDLAEAQKDLDKVNINKNANARVNLVALRNQIVSEISQRQFLLNTYSKMSDQDKSFKDFTSRDELPPATRDVYQDLLSMSLAISSDVFDIPKLPKFLKDLIENDLSNDEGWGSGKRFIINDDVILDMTLSINEPSFNRVDVTGNQDLVGGQMTGKIQELFWAGAVDFDSWRKFGHRGHQSFTRADFSNPETQCAPYAVFKLLQERRKIHNGSITVIGNEFYEPGDVVYINAKNMLYYVEDVQHSFSFSDARFTTRLSLSYGHPLGEYIPTPLDVIGKGLLSNKRRIFGEVKSIRNSVPQTNHIVPLGTLFVQDYDKLDDKEEAFRKAFLRHNKKQLRNIIIRASSKINTLSEDAKGTIEVRTYYVRQKNNEEVEAKFESRANRIGQWVHDAITGKAVGDLLKNPDSTEIEALSPDNVSDVIVRDIANELKNEDKELRRFPSAKAWSGSKSSNVYATVKGKDVSVPLNAIDVVFIIDKSRRGDQS